MGYTLYGPGTNRRSTLCRVFSMVLVLRTKTVITRAELGGALFLAAVIGVLLTSRKEEGKSD